MSAVCPLCGRPARGLSRYCDECRRRQAGLKLVDKPGYEAFGRTFRHGRVFNRRAEMGGRDGRDKAE